MQSTKQKRIKVSSKAVHDPLAGVVPPAVPIVAPCSMNHLKATRLWTILEEKRFSADEVVDRYPEIWRTIKFHKFEKFTKPRCPQVPTWVREFF